MTIQAPTAVLVLWWIALGLTLLVILPVTVILLHTTWRAASNIRRYTAEVLEAGLGIAGNTAALTALDETVGLAGTIVERTEALQGLTAEVKGVLRERAGL